MQNDPIAIVGAARTPVGGLQGDLRPPTASAFGAVAIRAALERAGIGAADVDEVIVGNVLPAGQAQAPARQAALGAGLRLGHGEITDHLFLDDLEDACARGRRSNEGRSTVKSPRSGSPVAAEAR